MSMFLEYKVVFYRRFATTLRRGYLTLKLFKRPSILDSGGFLLGLRPRVFNDSAFEDYYYVRVGYNKALFSIYLYALK